MVSDLINIVDKILWEEWDPLGVNDIEDARDEYHRYVQPVCDLLIKNGTVEEVTDYLEDIASHRMELWGTEERSYLTAQKLGQLSYI